MTLLEADAPVRLNGAHAPSAPAAPGEPPDAHAPEAGDALPPHLPRGLTNHAGTARRLLTRSQLGAVMGETRRLYEGTTHSLHEIARRVDALVGTVSHWGIKYHWVRPEGAPVKSARFRRRPRAPLTAHARRAVMVQRLYGVFDRQTSDLEARAVDPLGRTDEKDARTLSVLARTLETLIALDRDDGASSDTPEPADREKFNAELADRIRRWAEQGAPVEGPERAPAAADH
jgi:hypothetical protein